MILSDFQSSNPALKHKREPGLPCVPWPHSQVPPWWNLSDVQVTDTAPRPQQVARGKGTN